MEVDYKKRGGELRQRTYDFALRIVKLWKALPKGIEYEVIGKQLLRCGTSIGANYRAAIMTASAITVHKRLIAEGRENEH